tara:strand:- start:39 stop:491 length:453 start_codon:yes stop_codon:yes gene_type:complete
MQNNTYNNCFKLRENPETANAGKKWESDDDITLAKLVETSILYCDIAKQLKRTEGSIKARVIDKIIYPQYNDNPELLEELAYKYKFHKDYLKKKIEEKNNPNIKNGVEIDKNNIDLLNNILDKAAIIDKLNKQEILLNEINNKLDKILST